jgi:aminoglycoside phosphotransferase (APT) family kinase protein
MDGPEMTRFPEEAVAEFEELQPRLVGVAYALLGSVAEAEDAVQEAWIRLQGSNVEVILIHGDAWNGNLLRSPRGVALGDWDRVSHGPREVDLIPTWHATHRYGRTPDWTRQFIATYGYDLRDNPAYHDLIAMRDLAQLPGLLRRAPHSPPHAAALHQRLTDLRERNTTHQWIAL